MNNSKNEYEEILTRHPNLISNENALIKVINNKREIQENLPPLGT